MHWIGMLSPDPRISKHLALEDMGIAKLDADGLLTFGGGSTHLILKFAGVIQASYLEIVERVLRTKLMSTLQHNRTLGFTEQIDNRNPVDKLGLQFQIAAAGRSLHRIGTTDFFVDWDTGIQVGLTQFQYREGARYRTITLIGQPGQEEVLINYFLRLVRQCL